MRPALLIASFAIAGCSLAFDASRYEHDDAAALLDAGTDSGIADAGPFPCDETQPCCSWLDCDADDPGPYCVHDEARASWSCTQECADDLDCAGYYAGDACLIDSGARLCGCLGDGDCPQPGSPYCESVSSECVECRGVTDCPSDRACVDNECR